MIILLLFLSFIFNNNKKGQIWSIHTFTSKPTNGFLQTFRPPLFNIFRPHSTIVNSENQSNLPASATFLAQNSNSNQVTSSSMSNLNLNPFYNKPTFRPPIVRPTISSTYGSNSINSNNNNNNNNNNVPYYSTRTTPFLSNTQSMNYQFVTQSSSITTSTTTEQPFLISPNIAINNHNNNSNSSLTFHEVKPLPSSYQNYTNTSYLTNESSSVTVTNGNSFGESNQLQSSTTTNSLHAPESRGKMMKRITHSIH